MWKRNNYTLAYQWDCDTFENAEPDRPEFIGTEQEQDPVTGEMAWVYPHWRRLRKFIVSALFVSFAVLIVFCSVTAVIFLKVTGSFCQSLQQALLQLEMRHTFNCSVGAMDGSRVEEQDERDGNPILCLLFGSLMPTFLNAASIMLLGRIYEHFARKLTHWGRNIRPSSKQRTTFILSREPPHADRLR